MTMMANNKTQEKHANKINKKKREISERRKKTLTSKLNFIICIVVGLGCVSWNDPEDRRNQDRQTQNQEEAAFETAFACKSSQNHRT